MQKPKRETYIDQEGTRITREGFNEFTSSYQGRISRTVTRKGGLFSEHTIEIDKGEVRILAKLTKKGERELSNFKKNGFGYLPDSNELVYPPESAFDTMNLPVDGDKEGYHINKLSPRIINIEPEKIKKLSVEALSNLIRGIKGNEMIIYTGAGISMGGESPVWGMDEMSRRFGWDKVGTFEKYFTDPEEYNPNDLLQNSIRFRDLLIADVSTETHIAIAQIARKYRGCLVMTENLDFKHKAKGSRYPAMHLGSENFEDLISKATGRKILMTAGLSHDDRSLIRYLKEVNPDMVIVAFVLSEDTVPDYLGEEDFVVFGDVQETLPKLSEGLL